MSESAPCQTEMNTGMAHAVLTEVARMLEALAQKGEHSSIDLRSLPLTEADRGELELLLGRGEVQAELDVSGRSEIWETAYSGAWWIRHRGEGDAISSEEIAVCRRFLEVELASLDIESAAQRIQKDILENKPSNPEATHG